MGQDVHAAEAQVPGVPHDVAEGDGAGPALQGEHPVAGPGIIGDVALARGTRCRSRRGRDTESAARSRRAPGRKQTESWRAVRLAWRRRPGPRVANALETKCSTRNAPTGMMPLRECSLRSRNECPWPARSGGTPSCVLTGPAGLAVVATGPLVLSEMTGELFIISVGWKGSQGHQFSVPSF